jgi:hypothetical protein
MAMTEPNAQPWFRFSLRYLFAVVTAISIWLAAWQLFGRAFLILSVFLAIVGFWFLVMHDWFRNDTQVVWGFVILCGCIPGALAYLLLRRHRWIEEDLEFRRELASDPPDAGTLAGKGPSG